MAVESRVDKVSWDATWSGIGRAWFEHPAFLAELLACFDAGGGVAGPVLDVGCGRGCLVEVLRARLKDRVLGVDFSLESLRQGRAGCVQASATRLPVRAGACATVTAVLLIEHLPDVHSFFHEAVRALAPGGRLHLVFPNLHSLVTPALLLKRGLLGRGDIPWHTPLSAARVARALEGVGFGIERVDYLSIGKYRGGMDKLLSDAVRVFLPRRFREEIVMTARKPG